MPADIRGIKFNDINGNGVREPELGEVPLGGFTIYLDEAPFNGQLDPNERRVVTRADGSYEFLNVPDGRYFLREVPVDGFLQTTPDREIIINTEIGNQGGSIKIEKFLDLDLNGFRDDDEPGLAGVRVFLDLDEDGIRDITGPFEPFAITDANGEATFNNLPAGTYHVREQLEVKYKPTTPDIFIVDLELGEEETVVFGNAYKEGMIMGWKFQDNNENGIRDRGEPGLQGWTIELYEDTNANGVFDDEDMLISGPGETGTRTTNGNGFYIFRSVPVDAEEKTFFIREVLQPGFEQTNANVTDLPIILPAAGSRNVNFGNVPVGGSISGRKFEDENRNGVQNENEGELGLAGWTIRLLDSNNNLIGQQVTAADGSYSFDNVPPGTYNVREVQQEDYIQTTGDPPPIALVAGENVTDVNFGNDDGSITGIKFRDDNGNGVQDGNEPVIAAWQIELIDSEDDIISTTRTDSNGRYLFDDLGRGDYRVQEEQQDGFRQTAPAGNGTFNITLAAGEDRTDVNFGNAPLGSISGEKYIDENRNGIKDPAEDVPNQERSGWTIYLDSNDNGMLDSGEVSDETDINGRYSFSDLLLGDYIVREVLQEGFEQTEPAPQNFARVNLTINNPNATVDFGNAEVLLGSISGVKFRDDNRDGVQNGEEPGLENWTIELIDSSGAVIDTRITDANGDYSFTDLEPGEYTVREVLQNGFTPTAPTQNIPNQDSVTLEPGEIETVNFGNFIGGSISGVKFEDEDQDRQRDPGEIGLAGWTIYLDENDNGIRENSERFAVTDNNGSYLIDDLPPGTYNVREVQQPDFRQTTPDPQPIALAAGENVTDVNFGNDDGSITGLKFRDDNGNGVQDGNEPVIADWQIELIDSEGNISTTRTDSNGRYLFDDLGRGNYTVQEEQRDGFRQTAPAGDGTFNITLLAGEDESNVDFGNSNEGQIIGEVFLDVNQDRQQQTIEDGIPGIIVYLDKNDNGVLDEGEDSAITSSTGGYNFPNLLPGNYIVRQVPVDGFTSTNPTSTNPGIAVIINAEGQALNEQSEPIGNIKFPNTTVLMLEQKTGNAGRDDFLLSRNKTTVIHNFVDGEDFLGLLNGLNFSEQILTITGASNRTDIFLTDSDEPRLIGTLFGVDESDIDENDFISPNQQTGTAGRNNFSLSLSQTAVIQGFVIGQDFLTLPSGLDFSDLTITGEGDRTDIRLAESNQLIGVLVGVEPGDLDIFDFIETSGSDRGSISGVSFLDNNGNGVQDEGDNPGVGLTLYLDRNDDGVFIPDEDSVLTNITGSYSFPNLDPDTYIVRQVPIDGFSLTNPRRQVTIAAQGQNIENINFANAVSNPNQQTGTAGRNDFSLSLSQTAVIQGFVIGEDFLRLPSGLDFSDLTITGEGDRTEIRLAGSNQLIGVLFGVEPGDLDPFDFIETSGSDRGSISGVAFVDNNGNGVQDLQDNPGVGLTLYLDRDDNGVLNPGEDSVLTNITGSYSFPNLDPGNYIVRQVPVDGFSLTNPRRQVTITAQGQNIENIDFANAVSNPNQQTGTAGRNDFSLSRGQTTVIQGFVIGEDFLRLPSGLDFSDLTITGEGDRTEIRLADSNRLIGVLFGVEPGDLDPFDFIETSGSDRGSISGVAFVDNNGNGVQDLQDNPGVGLTLYLDRNDDGVLDPGEDSVLTNSTGSYSFPNLVPGNYIVRQVPIDGFALTNPRQEVTIDGQGQAIGNINFANAVSNSNQQTGTASINDEFSLILSQTTVIQGFVSGVTFLDNNGNGVQDLLDNPGVGLTLYLDANDDGLLNPGEDSVLTNSTGSYSFPNLDPGNYIVRQVPIDGFALTNPRQEVTIDGQGQAIGNINFANAVSNSNQQTGTASINDEFSSIATSINSGVQWASSIPSV